MACRDPISHRRILQLTNYRGHSYHLCGSTPCWLPDRRRLIISSDRDGCANLFALDVDVGSLEQLTDLRGPHRPRAARVIGTTLLEFAYGNDGFELQLSTLRMRSTPALPHARAADATPAPSIGVPCPQPGGRKLIFTANVDGYWQVHAARISAQSDLPLLAFLDADAKNPA